LKITTRSSTHSLPVHPALPAVMMVGMIKIGRKRRKHFWRSSKKRHQRNRKKLRVDTLILTEIATSLELSLLLILRYMTPNRE